MSDAPERVFCKEGYDAWGQWGHWYLHNAGGGTEYVRADRIEALEAQLAEADARAIRLAEMVKREAAAQANKLASHYAQLAKNHPNDEVMDRLHARSRAVINTYIDIHAIDPRALMEQMKEKE